MATLRTQADFPSAVALRREIRRQIAPIVHAVGLEDHEVSCRLFGDVRSLVVELHGPSSLRDVEASLGVRILDAVHAHGVTFGPVTVEIVD